MYDGRQKVFTGRFENSKEIVDASVDVEGISETKIGSAYPTGQFSLEGYYSSYRLHVSNRSSELLVNVNLFIPLKQLSHDNEYKTIQIISFDINPRKEKLVVVSVYRPPLQNSEYLLNAHANIIDNFFMRL